MFFLFLFLVYALQASLNAKIGLAKSNVYGFTNIAITNTRKHTHTHTHVGLQTISNDHITHLLCAVFNFRTYKSIVTQILEQKWSSSQSVKCEQNVKSLIRQQHMNRIQNINEFKERRKIRNQQQSKSTVASTRHTHTFTHKRTNERVKEMSKQTIMKTK